MRALRVLAGLLRETVAEWAEDKAPRLGAALAYYTLFSLAPLLLIAIVIASSLTGYGEAATQERVVAQIAVLIGTRGAEFVQSLLNTARIPREAGALTTAMGVGALLVGAVAVFAQLQDAFDTIWEVTPRLQRGILALIKARLVAFSMVLVVGFLLLAFLIVTALMAAVSDYLQVRLPYYGLLSAAVNVILAFVVATVLFAIMFKVLPDVRIAWRDVWPGAVLTALLFNLGRFGIAFYLANSRFSSAQSAAGSLIVLLIWIYYSAQILFFGAEFTQVYTRRYGKHRPVPAAHAKPVTEEARAQQGIPHAESQSEPENIHLEAPRPVPARPATLPAKDSETQAASAYAGALVGFAAGLSAGVVMALRTLRNGSHKSA